MCGRFVQARGVAEYVEALSPQRSLLTGFDDVPIGRYNVAPTTKVHLLHPEGEGIRMDAVPWGWAPFWAKGPGKRPPPVNARVETVATSKFFKVVWPHGRALVFADGWYEWVKDEADPKIKQPYFIRLKSQRPMFFGALAEVHPGLEPGDNDGFVIITAASDTGMVDIHDRRPLVLTPELAREWIEPDLSSERAEKIAREHCQPTEDFEWYPVSSMVGNVRNHGQELILPVG